MNKEVFSTVIENLKSDEGFAGSPYKDTRGFLTIGYGTKLPLSPKEAQLLLEYRLKRSIIELTLKEPAVEEQPNEIKEVLYNMVYQLGVSKLLEFENMFTALRNKDYKTMAKEMKNSLWYKQTPNRAQRLIDKVLEFLKGK